MSVDQLKTRILEDAKGEAQRIEAELRTKKHEQEKRIETSARQIEEAILDRARTEAKSKFQQLKQTNDLNAKARVLLVKQTALDELALQFQQQLLDLENKEAKTIIDQLMATIPAKSQGQVIAGAVQADAVKQASSKYKFTISQETIAGEGGFIFRGSRHEYNFLTSHLVKQVFIRHRAKLAQALFG
ncbi:MAG: hypothetical protein HYZ63_00445 [Candidatus Andersenbacteria bacterium]|nr:hypothetical protein [Candidatus Andersenbacteria bacterium]